MADFYIAIADVFSPDNEGNKYVNDKNDKGGETKFGISSKYHPGIDIKNLTQSEAETIWFHEIWKPYRIFEISNQKLANKLLNMIGNSNPIKVIKQLQTAIVKMGRTIPIDGIMGSITINTINSLKPEGLLSLFKLERVAYYVSLVDKDPTQLSFLKGWIRRAIQ